MTWTQAANAVVMVLTTNIKAVLDGRLAVFAIPYALDICCSSFPIKNAVAQRTTASGFHRVFSAQEGQFLFGN